MKVVGCLVAVACLMGCRLEGGAEGRQGGRLRIVATTGMIADGVRHIVGDSAAVKAMMGPGVDPHLYRPTPGDVRALARADVIVANGLHLEGKMAQLLEGYAEEKTVLWVADGVGAGGILSSADFQDAQDPHFWFDPRSWAEGLSHVARELGKRQPQLEAYYTANCERYRTRLEAMEKEVAAALAKLPRGQRILVTSHDAFSYFGRRFDLEVRGIQGISTLSEVGLREISEMVDFVVAHRLRAIFVETSTSDKTARAIVEGAGARGHRLALAGPLYSDALGEEGSGAETYIGMMRMNARAIVRGLSGAPHELLQSELP